MEEYSFEALGTKWSLLLDDKVFDQTTKKEIHQRIVSFEERFSRFRGTSEVNAFRLSGEGEYEISGEFWTLLKKAQILKRLTQGKYDPASGMILEHQGYDQVYSFTPSQEPLPSLPRWELPQKGRLWIERGMTFDLGGIGKGYAIDLIAGILKKAGHRYFLVDGGGDMYGTTKADGSGYQVALEWPGQEGTIYGTVELKNQGLAVSDRMTRRFGKYHHIVDAMSGVSTEGVLSAVALGLDALSADMATAVLMHWPAVERERVETELGVKTLLMTKEERVIRGMDWPGEIFEKNI